VSALSRRKGAAFERHVAGLLRELYPGARRGLGQARAGHEVADIAETPYRIECKHGARPDLFGALAQAERDAGRAGDARPVLVVARKNGGQDVALLRLADLLRLLRAAESTTRPIEHAALGPASAAPIAPCEVPDADA
jgi:hypothetical protein